MEFNKVDFKTIDFKNLANLYKDDQNNKLESDTFEEKLRKMSKSEKRRWQKRLIDTLIEVCNEASK